jgi:hypothetical protein
VKKEEKGEDTDKDMGKDEEDTVKDKASAVREEAIPRNQSRLGRSTTWKFKKRAAEEKA